MTQEIIDTTSGKIPMRTHWIPRMVAGGLQYEDLPDLKLRVPVMFDGRPRFLHTIRR